MHDPGSFFIVLAALGIGLFIFLICREIVCWYWKINERVALMNEIVEFHEKLIEIQAKANEKLDAVCEELTMLRQQQMEISVKQLAAHNSDGDA